MNYYEVAILKSPLEALTFQAEEEIEIGTKVEVVLRNRKNFCEAVIIKKVEEPTFKCTNIHTITNFFYDEKMLETARFISLYYVCSMGEALSIFSAFNKDFREEDLTFSFDSQIELSVKQQEAYEFCKEKSKLFFLQIQEVGKQRFILKLLKRF